MAAPWRIPCDDDYLLLVGRATYTFAYVEWGIAYLLHRLDPSLGLDDIAALTAGRIGKQFLRRSRARGVAPELANIADEFLRLVALRDDIIHSHPATTGSGEQQLSRWSPKRGADTRWVDRDVLTSFIREAEALSGQVAALLHPAESDQKPG